MTWGEAFLYAVLSLLGTAVFLTVSLLIVAGFLFLFDNGLLGKTMLTFLLVAGIAVIFKFSSK